MAGIALLSRNFEELPVLSKCAASERPGTLAASTNPIYFYELFAMAATIFQMREQLTGERAIRFVRKEAA